MQIHVDRGMGLELHPLEGAVDGLGFMMYLPLEVGYRVQASQRVNSFLTCGVSRVRL